MPTGGSSRSSKFSAKPKLRCGISVSRWRSARCARSKRWSQPAQTTVLELCIAGSFQANIPLDFLLDRERTTVHKLYLGEHPIPPNCRPTISSSIRLPTRPTPAQRLRRPQAFIAAQDRPALNAPASRTVDVARRGRGAVRRFGDGCGRADTRTSTVRTLARVRRPYPFLIRPLDSHAGNDLAKIDDARVARSLSRRNGARTKISTFRHSSTIATPTATTASTASCSSTGFRIRCTWRSRRAG